MKFTFSGPEPVAEAGVRRVAALVPALTLCLGLGGRWYDGERRD